MPKWPDPRLFSPETLKKPQKQCWESPNIVSGLPTLFWRSQHCWEAPNIVFLVPNIVVGLPTLLGGPQHCFFAPNIVSGSGSIVFCRESLFPGKRVLENGMKHCFKRKQGRTAGGSGEEPQLTQDS